MRAAGVPFVGGDVGVTDSSYFLSEPLLAGLHSKAPEERRHAATTLRQQLELEAREMSPHRLSQVSSSADLPRMAPAIAGHT